MNSSLIQIQDLHYHYADGTEALHHIGFTLPPASSLGIIGPNGSGKTTLMLHFNGIMLPQTGQVQILGIAVKKKNVKLIRKKVGLMFQDPDDQLFSKTVYEDVAFGPFNFGYTKEEVDARVKRALAEVHMQGFENRFPHHLSQGEKKRVALATVLSMDCELLALDEPTSGLDPFVKEEITDLLQSIPIPKVIISHDFNLIQTLCDHTLLLSRGKMIGFGKTKDMLLDHDYLRRIFRGD